MNHAFKGCYVFGEFRLDGAERRLLRNEAPISLPPKILDTLLLLVENAGHLVEKDEFMKLLWPSTFVGEDALARNISILRKTLGESSDSQSLIATVPTRGYRFVAAVRKVPRGDREPAGRITPATETAPDPTNVSLNTGSSRIAPRTDRAARPWWRNRTILELIGVAAAALIAVGTWFVAVRSTGETIDSLAVLPFANASTDANTDYLSDGIAESVIDSLSQLPNIRVASRNSAFRYKGTEVDPRTVGRELGVRAVLTGRIAQRGDDLTISSDLVDTQRDRELWGEHYSRRISDLAAVQEEIERQISTNLRLRLTSEEKKRLSKGTTENPEAYQFYLKGRYSWNKRTLPDGQKAIDYFQQAVEKDPGYALAYAGLADCYGLGFGSLSPLPPREAIPRAKIAAMKALELDGTLSEAHTSLANAFSNDYDWPGAEKEFRRAIELKPSYATAHEWYSQYLAEMGRLDEALAEAKQAERLDPLSPSIVWNEGWVLMFARNYDRAIQQFQKALELDPNLVVANVWLGRVLEYQGKYSEAIDWYEKYFLQNAASSEERARLEAFYSNLRRALRKSGSKGAYRLAIRMSLQNIQRSGAPPSWIDAVGLAYFYAALAEKDKAFEWIERLYEEHALSGLKLDPAFDPLRSDPRYGDLLRRMGLPQSKPGSNQTIAGAGFRSQINWIPY